MGKKSRMKQRRREKVRSPEVNRLLEDYFATKEALDTGPGVAFFRGQAVTSESLTERFFAAGEALGVPRTELFAALVVEMNHDLVL